jgi:hypothetical protein
MLIRSYQTKLPFELAIVLSPRVGGSLVDRPALFDHAQQSRALAGASYSSWRRTKSMIVLSLRPSARDRP